LVREEDKARARPCLFYCGVPGVMGSDAPPPGIAELYSAKPLGSPSCTRQSPWDRRVVLGKSPGIAELYSAKPLGSPSCTRQKPWDRRVVLGKPHFSCPSMRQSFRLSLDSQTVPVWAGIWRWIEGLVIRLGREVGEQGQDALASYPDLAF
jgi:hypothetical protein